MRLSLIAVALCGALLSGCAASPAQVSRTIVIPAGRDAAYDEYLFAPAVRVGDMVIVSGIPSGSTGNYEDDIRRMFRRTQEALEAAGATMDDIVEINTFHRDVHDTASFDAEFQRFREVYRELKLKEHPAWTAVGTTALLAPKAAVEMRVIAVIGSSRNSRVQRGR
jgi:enamine deaminase RidA (YjgF/YER057c/UK114 family)